MHTPPISGQISLLTRASIAQLREPLHKALRQHRLSVLTRPPGSIDSSLALPIAKRTVIVPFTGMPPCYSMCQNHIFITGHEKRGNPAPSKPSHQGTKRLSATRRGIFALHRLLRGTTSTLLITCASQRVRQSHNTNYGRRSENLPRQTPRGTASPLRPLTIWARREEVHPHLAAADRRQKTANVQRSPRTHLYRQKSVQDVF
jgi:hypothetical protein